MKTFPREWVTTMKQGEAWPSWVLYLYDGDEETELTSGFDIKCQVRNNANSTTVQKVFTLGAGLVQDGNKITWDGEVDIEPRTYVVDVYVEDSNGEKFYTTTGLISVLKPVTV